MSKAVAQGYLIAVAELMIKPRGCKIESRVKRKESTVGLELIYGVGISRSLKCALHGT